MRTSATFVERYRRLLHDRHNHLCVGLDPDTASLPESIRGDDAMARFNRVIIDATAGVAIAYKPNLAFYECEGAAGMRALEQTLDAVPEGIITIGDAKRGDIGNTSARYATALFDMLGFDAITVSPYLGIDAIEPFFGRADRCVFVLALTSNPGSADFQRQESDGIPLYARVIDRCLERFGDRGELGFVVGATHPSELEEVRARVGQNVPLLIPGLGAQGGDATSALEANRGGVAFFNVSRGISRAGSGPDFAERAAEAARSFASQLSTERQPTGP